MRNVRIAWDGRVCTRPVQPRSRRGAGAPSEHPCAQAQPSRLRQPSPRRSRAHPFGIDLAGREVRASSLEASAEAVTASTPCKVYKVTLRKPMGLVLKEDKVLGVVVEEVVEGGNAAKGGEVQVGDVLSRVSAVILKSGKEGEYEKEGYGQRPYTNWEKTMFDCKGQSFDTVMSAISSNNERWGFFNVTLELKRFLKGF